jgi:hypothetical protein
MKTLVRLEPKRGGGDMAFFITHLTRTSELFQGLSVSK